MVGVAHRDLKPQNLLLDMNYNLKIADMGLAGPIQGRTGSGYLKTQVGTKGYMAPELVLGSPYEGKSVDVFSAGIILFNMVTRGIPFQEASNGNDLYRKLASFNPSECKQFWDYHSNGR